ncbi:MULTISPECIES: hypothetical protein [Alteromonadaceae]|uniref:hypothetical protein n=1 Tax=Alteromonadaceae TaxID=72275 RepID=UPI001C0825D4|nr:MULTISPECIES: hypothetical protein [Aliiglaciecola]MBU2876548.1 hypothetical protein [Aliiglaciecola lipolytica]MDO6711517.1 hypothetical protein [Aliiglaciecola sp. 2_MG-2023]MDO6752507.1 hypothetical protein [Aliiglaciecola sp. 1_MG-2023]
MPDLNESELLAAWMQGELSPQQQKQFEKLCTENERFSEQVEMANQASLLAQDYRSEIVPKWNKANSFDYQQPPKWWQWQGLPVFSSALSIVAIVLVFSGFEASVENGKVTFGFADSNQSIEQKVAQQLNEFKVQQNEALNSYVMSLREQQLDASTQLTQYLLASSRQERKEDFGELIKFINEQRNDDQLFYARQLNQLEKAIYDSPSGNP